jgi:hypothetical protein
LFALAPPNRALASQTHNNNNNNNNNNNTRVETSPLVTAKPPLAASLIYLKHFIASSIIDRVPCGMLQSCQ